MTDKERVYIARRLLQSLDDGFFYELDYTDLQAFYGAKCDCEPVPSTACCARDAARRIIGEPEASRLVSNALKKAKGR